MSYLHRVTPNKDTTSRIEGKYNEKGQLVDANTKEVLVQGKIDKGHKHGYEERVMRECAERCHMSQKDYNKMMQNPKLYQFESFHNNRTHKFESKDKNLQLHNCFEVIRDYKGKNREKVIEKYGKSDFTYSNRMKNSKNNHVLQKASNKVSSHNNSAVKSGHLVGKSSSTGLSSSNAMGGISSTGKTGHSGAVSGGSHSGISGGHGGSSGGHGGSSGGGHGGGHGK